MTAEWRERLLALLSPLGLLLVWELVVRAGWLDSRLFPPPTRIIAALWDLLISGVLLTHLKASLGRILGGFVVGTVPGLVLGVAMGLSRPVRLLLQPLVAATYPVPRSAMLPLILIIFGLGELSKVMIVAISVFYLVLINTAAGVMNIAPIYLDVGRNLRATRLQTFWTIALPGAMPLVMTGMRLGLGIGLIVIVVAEFTAANEGIGYMIWESWQTFAVEKMYVGLIVISLLGWLTSVLSDELEYRLVPWRER